MDCGFLISNAITDRVSSVTKTFMDKGKSHLATSLLAAAALTTTAATSQAVIFTEPGTDVGQTLTTAANTGLSVGGSGTLTGVSGTIGTATDADLYKFTVNSTISFTASATGGASSAGNFPIDTSLFLFDSLGNALVANDDQANYYQSSFTISLTAGTYYLGISLSGNEPINSNSQLLFTVDQPTTSTRGPAAGLNPTTLSDFNGNTQFAETGPYAVSITAAVPEPTTNAALAFGGLASLVFLRRLRRAQNA